METSQATEHVYLDSVRLAHTICDTLLRHKPLRDKVRVHNKGSSTRHTLQGWSYGGYIPQTAWYHPEAETQHFSGNRYCTHLLYGNQMTSDWLSTIKLTAGWDLCYELMIMSDSSSVSTRLVGQREKLLHCEKIRVALEWCPAQLHRPGGWKLPGKPEVPGRSAVFIFLPPDWQ